MQGVSANAAAGVGVDQLTVANAATGYPGIPALHTKSRFATFVLIRGLQTRRKSLFLGSVTIWCAKPQETPQKSSCGRGRRRSRWKPARIPHSRGLTLRCRMLPSLLHICSATTEMSSLSGLNTFTLFALRPAQSLSTLRDTPRDVPRKTRYCRAPSTCTPVICTSRQTGLLGSSPRHPLASVNFVTHMGPFLTSWCMGCLCNFPNLNNALHLTNQTLLQQAPTRAYSTTLLKVGTTLSTGTA